MCVFYPCRPWRLGSGSMAKFLLLPGMSLRVYVRAHAGSISVTQTHTLCKYPGNGLCMYSRSLFLLLSEEAAKRFFDEVMHTAICSDS